MKLKNFLRSAFAAATTLVMASCAEQGYGPNTPAEKFDVKHKNDVQRSPSYYLRDNDLHPYTPVRIF